MSPRAENLRRTASLIIVGPGVALLSALLFGASTPLAKLLLDSFPPALLAGVLYCGSGLGLAVMYFVRQKSTPSETKLAGGDFRWLWGAVLFGGVLGPVLLMVGLSASSASSASLLLNFEAVFTALIAWFVVRENFSPRIVFGILLIVAGGALLSWTGSARVSMGSVAVIAACLCWGIDNNFTQRISDRDPMQIAFIKGLVAGAVNIALALIIGQRFPGVNGVAAALLVGFIGYGISLVLFIVALRRVGTARTSAYFSSSPFLAAALSLFVFQENPQLQLIGAGILMAAGLWLHLTEQHKHEHTHEYVEHAHSHVHDEHHAHKHESGFETREPHTHWHEHEQMTHSHHHYPDTHHRHPH